MRFPTLEEVNKATHTQICYWHRFLPLAQTDEQLEIINEIFRRFKDGGGMTPAISKGIGWGK